MSPSSHHDPELCAWAELFAQGTSELDVVRVGGGAALVAPLVDSLLFNRAIASDPSEVHELARLYQRRGIDRFMITLPRGVIAKPDATLGLEPFHRAWIKLSCRPQAQEIAANGYIVRAARPEDADAVGELYCAGFDVPREAAAMLAGLIGRPRWHMYVAELGAVPNDHRGPLVGLGITHLDRGHAYLFGGVTSPRHRCRGIQRALIAARVNHAHRCGATSVSTDTGIAVANQPNHSQHNLERAGLRVLYSREHLVPIGTTWIRGAQP